MTTDDGVTVYDRGEPTRKRGQRPAPRPLDALESQVALIDALDSSVGAGLVRAMVDATDSVSFTAADLDVDRRAAREIGHALNEATTVVVTERMLDFVLDRLSSVPFGDPLMPDDLFFESAYILFPRPVDIPDVSADDFMNVYPPRKVAQFDAGFYFPQSIGTVDALRGESVPRDGIMYVQATSVRLMEQYFDDLRVAVEAGTREVPDEVRLADIDEAMRQIHEQKLKHVPIYSSGIAFGLTWDPELREETFVLTPAGEFERRFWTSLLRTLKEEIFAPVRFKRADYRRAARRGLIPDVVVADLRRVKHRSKEEILPTGETVMWSHRWMRSGHPRTIHKGTDKERTIWVREHVCGPKSMPLILKDRVYRLSK
jgi:hypothetical protein